MLNTEFRTGVIKPIECVKEAWEIIKPDYWILFAISIVGALIGGVTLYILFGAMICGIFYAFLRKIDGFPVVFDDLWKGMNYLGPGLVVTLLVIGPLLVYYFFVYVSLIAAVVAGAQMGEAGMVGAMIAIFAVDAVILVILVCFHTLMMFAYPLIVDRGLGPMGAIKTSARAVWQNLGGVVGLILVNMGLGLLGELAFCVGIYLVIPVIIATNAVAYRKVFPRPDRQNLDPPPPYAYQGL